MTIIQQPDSLSFSGNLKKFIISTNVTTPFSLMMGQTTILTNFYNPGVNGQIEIDLREIIERQLSIILPTDGDAVTDQTTGVADFTANIGIEPVEFRVIKGGVYDLDVSAATFCNEHFLTWQAQEKKILQDQPEWLTLYATEEWEVKCKAYYLNNSEVASETVTLATIPEDHLQTLDVSWQAICDAITATQPIAWDIWFEDQSGRLSYIQRYQLRNAGAEENVFVWTNTLGGVDSASFTGFAEDDQKLEHQIAELYSEDLDEYRIEKKTEIKQSTGFLTAREGIWLRDFFYSKRRYKIELDGSVRSIVLVDSKVVNSTADDLKEYEFTFRYSCDNSLLNLDRVVTDLPAPEGLSDFFLTELLAGLPVADYDGNLNIAVQSPFASGWMKLSLDQLFNQALPEFIDNITIRFIDGKLCTDVGAVIMGLKPKHGFESSGTSLLAFNSQTRIFSITANGFSSFPVWNMGEPLYKETESALIDNVEGIWYIYYKDTLLNTNVLVASQTKWDRNVDIPIAFVVWESGAGTLVDNRYKYTEVNHELLTRYANMPHPALDIYLDTTNFNGFLSDQETTVQKALDKYDDHKHWKLYTPDYLDGFVYTSIVNGVPTLNILGDIIQNGSAYETHAEQVYTKDDLIILRDGALSALAEGQYAGFKAKLYDGTNDGSLVFDAYGIARVGDVGFEQPIATRIETPTNDHFAYWEAANSRLNFKLLDTSFVSENTNLYFTTARAKAAIYADLHANYLPYFNGAILTDSGAYWEETEYGASPSVPGRLLELSSSDNFHLRIGEGSVNPLHTYDIGRVSATGHLTFYGNQTGYVGYVFDGVDGQLLHIDNLMATFCGGITAVFAAASTDTDKFIVSDGGVLKSRTGTQVRLDIEAQPLDADLTAIAALSGTTGLLRKTAADTWELDTTAYLSSLAHNLTGDVSGAYGSNTVDKIKNKSIASLTAGFFKYDGSGFVFDSNTYLTSLAHNLAGDVSGAYGSNTVDKIKNKSIATLTAGFLKYDGSGFIFDSTAYQTLVTNLLHANYLPYWNGSTLIDSGAYWQETEYGISTLVPGRLLELSSSDNYHLRIGEGSVNPLHTYDIGRVSATGHLTFYGNQTGYIGYVFDGIDGQLLHMDNAMATFSGGLTATFTSASVDTDKFIVSDSGVLKYRTGSQVLSDIGAYSVFQQLITGLHGNYLPYWNGTILTDSGAYWSEADYGSSLQSPGRLLELTSSESFQLRLGNGLVNPFHTYDIGRSSANGHLTFFGNQSGYIGYVFDGADGQLLHMDNTLATFCAALQAVTATFTAVGTASGGHMIGVTSSGLLTKNITDLTYILNYGSSRTFSSPYDLVDKEYVDATTSGLAPKLPCDCAATGNLTLSGTQTIDGYSAGAGTRVLCLYQSTPSQNGVWIVASGAWTRSTDLDSWSELYKAYVVVTGGSTKVGTSWVCTIGASGTVDVNDVTWQQFGIATTITASNGLHRLGNDIHAEVDGATIEVVDNALRVKPGVFITSLAHNLVGDVSGAYGSNTVDKIKNKSIATLSAGFFKYDGSGFVFDGNTYLTSLAHNLAGDVSGAYGSNTVDKIKNKSIAELAAGFFKYDGSGFVFDSNTYLTSLAHNLTGDVSGAYGSNTVDKIKNKSIATLTAGFFKYDGSGFVFDSNTYLTSLAHNLTGDVSGAYGSNTVDKIKNKSIATLTAGFFKYDGSGFVFDSNTYLTSLAHNLAGDVSGAYGSNTVDKIKNKSIATLTAGFLKYDGSGFVFDSSTYQPIGTNLHANYLPYWNGTELTDSGAYWEETEYGLSTLLPGRLLELSTSDNYQLRVGSGSVNPLHTYDIGRSSATGHLTFYGNQSGYVGYVFDGINGQSLHLDNVMATFAGGLTATFAAAATSTDKYLVSDSGVVKYRTASQLLSDVGLTATGALYGTGTSFSGVALGAGQVMRRNLTNTAYEAYTPGGTIPSGSVAGQILWWDHDNTTWKVTNTSYLKYIDADGKLVFGSITIGAGNSVDLYITPGSAGANLYGATLTRSAYTKANYPTTNILLRPDISGYANNTYGNRLILGRNGYITDIVIGDGTGTLTDGGTGKENAYIQFPAYTAGVALFSSVGLISSLATSGSGTRFLREDGSWQAVSASGSYLPLIGGTLTGQLNGTSISMTGTITGSEIYRGSSRELKTNILDFDTDAISFLNSISIKKYNLKQNGLFGIGFIAEDTHEWLSGEDQKSHIFGNHLGILTKAIQDEDKKVEGLKAQVAELNARIKDLENSQHYGRG